jgi:hypothetical protein
MGYRLAEIEEESFGPESIGGPRSWRPWAPARAHSRPTVEQHRQPYRSCQQRKVAQGLFVKL